MDETVLQKNKRQDSTPAQSSPGAKREPRRSGRLILFLFVSLACLAALAVYGIMNRSAATDKLEQQANQTATEQTV
ncbi:MAG: hypothetical protein JOZ31_27595, partial [Verrucomicrobia bacterium]|nr:hypothetical protein [Verrucomicrobiota bacterium]